MKTQGIQLSRHASTRQAQRNLSAIDIDFVLAHGQRVYAGGAVHVFLGRRSIPREPGLARRFARLEGTILVIGEDEEVPVVITVYRNRTGFKALRSKVKYKHTRQR